MAAQGEPLARRLRTKPCAAKSSARSPMPGRKTTRQRDPGSPANGIVATGTVVGRGRGAQPPQRTARAMKAVGKAMRDLRSDSWRGMGSGPPVSCDRVRPLQRESRPMPSPIRISPEQARDYLLGHLGLRAIVDPPGAEGTRAVLRRLRAIQLDPLDPIGTNADLVVQARVDGVR